MTTAVQCNGIWKSYSKVRRIGLKSLLLGRGRLHESRFARQWALEDVSFDAARGEGFGIVGHNGSGKTTLLTTLLGTVRVDHGSVSTHGRIASLIELGAGFHPELSGRDNIFLYGSILGMRLRETKERHERIVAFSELESAVEEPIRTYSAGMITRLAFSIIANAPADILLIDEVLAVGDARFQEKCQGFLAGFKAAGGTLVIVSHNMDALARLCERGMCLDLGKIIAIGAMSEAIATYNAKAQAEQSM